MSDMNEASCSSCSASDMSQEATPSGSGEQELRMSTIEAEGENGTASSSWSWLLTECREFLKRTFSLLTAKQLNSCARVCKVWNKEARRILVRRQTLNWITDFKSLHLVDQEGPHTERVSHPMGFFGQNLQRTLESAGSQPKFALMFTEYSKGSEYGCENSSKKNFPKKSQEIVDYVKSLLPADCPFLSLMTPGTVAPKSSCTTEPYDESESGGGVLCTLFPNMPGVEIKVLPIAPKLLQGGVKDELWERWLQAGVSPEDTQCILLFGWGFISGVQQAAAELQRLFQEKARRNPVIAGAIVNRLLSKGLCSKSEESSGAIGVTFSGRNVRAASVLLSEAVQKREDIRRTFGQLKDAVQPVRPGHSAGFMFACTGRGAYFYEEDNVESEEFHKVFPDTPLFGLFGGGEIGCQNLTAGREINEMCLSAVAHAYTTIMCLLTFDPS